MLMVSEYQAEWQRAWRQSEDFRRLRMPWEDYRHRFAFYWCSPRLFGGDRAQLPEAKVWGAPAAQYSLISSTRPARGWCPSWGLAAMNIDADDASTWRDGALLPQLRQGIARTRRNLIATLDSAYGLDTTNGWLAGHVTRHFVDARDYGAALQASTRCRAAEWWCASLRGFAQARAGNILAADSSFALMRRAMPEGERCAWADVTTLLPPDRQRDYLAYSCAERDSINARLWWLADPSYREAGNARLVDQEARRVEIALRRATIQDERYSFDDDRGGDAIREVLHRYGWPSYAAWFGVALDRNRSYQGLQINESAPPSPPYSTLEYSRGRVSTIPAWHAIIEPFRAVIEDWSLSVDDSSGAPSLAWWPQEHFRPMRSLVQLPGGQTVSIRRQSWVEVVAAVDLSHAALERHQSVLDVILLATPGPHRVDSIDAQRAAVGTTIRLRGAIASTPTILSIEAAGTASTVIDGRVRYAYAPPPPLSVMSGSDIAISDMAILSPLSEAQVAAPADSLLKYLRSRLILPSTDRRVSLYWESYNTLPSDSATIALRVVPQSQAGLLRRLGVATGIVRDPSRGIEVRWRDVDSPNGVTTLRGPVPTQMRAITIDFSALTPGRYVIDISMDLRDGRSSRRQATIELVP